MGVFKENRYWQDAVRIVECVKNSERRVRWRMSVLAGSYISGKAGLHVWGAEILYSARSAEGMHDRIGMVLVLSVQMRPHQRSSPTLVTVASCNEVCIPLSQKRQPSLLSGSRAGDTVCDAGSSPSCYSRPRLAHGRRHRQPGAGVCMKAWPSPDTVFDNCAARTTR